MLSRGTPDYLSGHTSVLKTLIRNTLQQGDDLQLIMWKSGRGAEDWWQKTWMHIKESKTQIYTSFTIIVFISFKNINFVVFLLYLKQLVLRIS